MPKSYTLEEKNLKTFNDFIMFAANYKDETIELDCDFMLNYEKDNTIYNKKAYAVAISNRNLTFYCEDVVLSYVIDIYGDKPIAELIEIDDK
jgi:hypothetical protein